MKSYKKLWKVTHSYKQQKTDTGSAKQFMQGPNIDTPANDEARWSGYLRKLNSRKQCVSFNTYIYVSMYKWLKQLNAMFLERLVNNMLDVKKMNPCGPRLATFGPRLGHAAWATLGHGFNGLGHVGPRI